jgi:hypothetical protein
MTYTIGANCHILLTHPDVNSGDPYGFLLQSLDNNYGPSFAIQRDSTDGIQNVRIFFHVLLADGLINMDGTLHEQGRTEMYNMLTAYLARSEELTITTIIGTIANIGATGHTATETHYSELSIVAIQLNNVGLYFDPVDITQYQLSLWDGTLTWASSYWR